MLKSERKQIILSQLKQDGFITLENLTVLLSDTSESTIRRDLDELAADGQLKRVHGGGAESIHGLKEEIANSQKAIRNVKEKAQLAGYAADLIKEGDVVFLEASTTNELLIPHLANRQVTVVTNSIHHAVKLVDLGVSTRIVGGKVKHSTDASIGSTAQEQIRQLNFDCAFIGANGVDTNYFTTPDMEEAVIKRTVIANAQKAYVLADTSKLGQITYAKVAEVEKVTIITNASEEELLKELKEKTRVIEV
jgi:DeoR family fructose operon transcriptional repressor